MSNKLTVELVEQLQQAVEVGKPVETFVEALTDTTLPGLLEYGCARLHCRKLPELPPRITGSEIGLALSEGCDPKFQAFITKRFLFQSTHPRRVRLPIARGVFHDTEFQSTHPRRVRQPNQTKTSLLKGFNPRTREGCDGPVETSISSGGEFQSTHPRRVRLSFV